MEALAAPDFGVSPKEMRIFSHSNKNKQHAHGLVVPLNADSVEAPVIQYGGGLTAINFITDDERWGRVTFEGLDSFKVSRGEYEPYENGLGTGHANRL